ncbi:heparan-alpha-glucosaminide N-acetyltransferase-like [Neocloeon triangulifer]|uniref:heparan-alpha-glucosaminide N-acetyltransferase-like n=1 Tax=Neocloeon triangulifer TaxID=2078957 RepID=UPI00286F4330|nr:heparan-alpha-glucosaminide N-acetyltransferase-like [Neocloeon triangulifer]
MDFYSWVEGRSREPVRGLYLNDLRLDEAFLNVSSQLNKSVWVYSQRQPCYKCTQFSLMGELAAHNSTTYKVSSLFDLEMLVLNQNLGDTFNLPENGTDHLECSSNLSFGEFGIYDLVVSPANSVTACRSETVVPPVNIYLALVVVTFMSLAGLLLLYGLYILWNIYNERFLQKNARHLECLDAENNSTLLEEIHNNNNTRNSSINKKDTKTVKFKTRLHSLDVFRGCCIIPLVFYFGHKGGYFALEHVVWDGVPAAEWPFPCFLWIMSVCIPLKMKSDLAKKVPKSRLIFEITKRCVLLFALGLMINSVDFGVQLETMRYYNVLQRIAVMYLISSILFAFLWPRDYKKFSGTYGDLRVLLPQWLIHLVIHAIYLGLVFLLPVPGCPTGYLGPGGLSEGGKYFNCTGGTHGYVDKLIHDEAHLLQASTTKDVYKFNAFEPVGPFSTLPSLLTVILGAQAGAILVMHSDWHSRKLRLVIWGVGCIALGLTLHLNEIIPMNKHLWSTSFSLVTGGAAFLVLTVFMYLVDVTRIWNGFPLLQPGMNCLLLYVGSRITADMWPWHFAYGKMDTHFMKLIDSCWSVFIWVSISVYLYTKKVLLTA